MTATLERPLPVPDASSDADAPDDPPTAQGEKPRRRRWRTVVAVVLVLLVPVGWSYGNALTYPGSASASVRSVDWLRSHGGASIVNQAEVWYYSKQEPPIRGAPSGPPPAPTAAQVSQVQAARQAGTAPTVTPAVALSGPGEGQLIPGPSARDGRTSTYTAWYRPDPRHPTLVAGALWIDPRAATLDLVAGTKEPGGGPWPGEARIPTGVRSSTVAAFNSGFLLRDSGGGFYEDGTTKGRLEPGMASLVIDRSGTPSLGEWGRDVRMTSGTQAVRQNLHLIVDGSRPVRGLVDNADRLWGSRKSQLQWTWRSGLGIDAAGNLVYVAGDHFTLTTLADALTQAGAVRGMQLDIHTNMVTANLFRLGTGDPRTAPVKLLPSMSQPATRYRAADQRDFVTVGLR